MGATALLTACNSSSDKTAGRQSDTTLPVTTVCADTNQANIQFDPGAVQPATNPVTTNSGAGLNPAHGEPGHRCDIPVGSPLNTPPPHPKLTTPTVTAPTVTTNPAPTVTTTTVPPVTAPTVTAPGMNPAHGQPGHRCDIPVGSPLNSKSAN